MVTRTNGAPRQGVWFSSDVRFVTVTITGSTTFLTDLTVAATGTTDRQADVVNSDLEQILEILSTRGTVIGLTVETDLILHVMVDYGQAYDPNSVTLGNQTAQDVSGAGGELELAIEALANVTTATIAIEEGFGPIALGTPA